MDQILNVVVGQSPGDLGGPQARLNWLKHMLPERDDHDIDLLVLPELFLTGYNIGNQVSDWSEKRDGPMSRQIADLARQAQVVILFGYGEREGENIFNSAACYDVAGVMIGHHRKLLLPPGFEGQHFSPGQSYSLFQIGEFKIAILICYDAEFPENFRYVSTSGADLVVVPTALGAQWGIVSEKVMPSRAFENGVFVVYANHCGDENGLDYFGGSCIIGPDGQEIARADGKETSLSARLDLKAVKAAQTRLPYHTDALRLPVRTTM